MSYDCVPHTYTPTKIDPHGASLYIEEPGIRNSNGAKISRLGEGERKVILPHGYAGRKASFFLGIKKKNPKAFLWLFIIAFSSSAL